VTCGPEEQSDKEPLPSSRKVWKNFQTGHQGHHYQRQAEEDHESLRLGSFLCCGLAQQEHGVPALRLGQIGGPNPLRDVPTCRSKGGKADNRVEDQAEDQVKPRVDQGRGRQQQQEATSRSRGGRGAQTTVYAR